MGNAKSIWTIFLIIVAAGVAFLLYEVLLILFLAFLLTLALHPSVAWLKSKGIPRTLSVLVMVAMSIGGLAALALFVGPELVSQARSFIQQAPQYLQEIEDVVGIQIESEALLSQLTSFSSEAGNLLYSVTSSVVTIVTSLVLVVVLAIYWLIYYDEVKDFTINHLPKKHRKLVKAIYANVEKNLKGWVIGQGSLCLIVGTLAGIAYFIIGLPFALPLALFAAVMEIVPNLGPTLAIIPAVLVALTVSPLTALITLGVYVLIQLFESYFLNPKIMSRVTHLNPFIVIVAIIVGTHLIGIIGTLIAVPSLLVIMSVIQAVKTVEKK